MAPLWGQWSWPQTSGWGGDWGWQKSWGNWHREPSWQASAASSSASAADWRRQSRASIQQQRHVPTIRLDDEPPEWDVDRLLCEGGGRLNASLLAADLVDEIHLTLCPTILGGKTAPTIADGPIAKTLPDAKNFQLKEITRAPKEAFLIYRSK